MSQVRVALPPLADLTLDTPVTVAWLDRQGKVIGEEQSTLLQLGQGGKNAAVCFFLHPRDSLLASLELPLLPAAKTAAAVQCAAQALILGRSDDMHIAYSPRDEQGRVHIAWLSREWLSEFGRLLHLARLTQRGLYPAAYGLPVGDAPVACMQDGHLLVRYSLQHAVVHPHFDDAVGDLLREAGPGVQWVGDLAPDTPLNRLPVEQRWSGALPGWGLHGGVQQNPTQTGWGRAAACCTLAVAVWTLGLNLYASREAAQGQQLKAQMVQRVKQAFPQLPVILNPLQQARQQLAARETGTAEDPDQAFTRLMQQAGNGIPLMAGSVQSLVFDNGELQLNLLSDARRNGSDKQWQGALAQAGIAISATDDGWLLRTATESAVNETENSSGGEDE